MRYKMARRQYLAMMLCPLIIYQISLLVQVNLPRRLGRNRTLADTAHLVPLRETTGLDPTTIPAATASHVVAAEFQDPNFPKAVPFIAWPGVVNHIQWAVPPEIELLNVNDGKLPAVEHLSGPNQMVVAHAKSGRLNLTVNHWEKRIVGDGAPNIGVRNIGLYLVGDELNFGSTEVSSLLEPFDIRTNRALGNRKSPFSYVIRDYYFEHLKDAPETQIVPLGSMTCKRKKLLCNVAPPSVVFTKMLASGIPFTKVKPEPLTIASKRTRRCYYAGSERAGRKEMQDSFNRTGGCEIYITPGFNKGLNKTEYQDILRDTVFGLVPAGNSQETHRLAEILMLGGIPCMVDKDANATHMRSYPEPIPVLSGPTWETVETRMNAMTDEMIDQMQRAVLKWWQRYWSCVHEDVRWILAQARAVSEGRTLCNAYQATTYVFSQQSRLPRGSPWAPTLNFEN